MDPHVPGRRAHRRFSIQLEVTITLRNPFARSSGPLNEGLTLVGRTKNICETGLAVVVSAGNIDRYLKRKDLPIEIELRLPSGPVKVQVTPIHYKRFSSSEGSVTYLIGSSFSQTEPADLEVLLKFLHSLPPA